MGEDSGNNDHAVVVTFNKSELPAYLEIPGEHLLTKVYEYKEKPMMCRKCLEFGHTKANCRSPVTNCGRCSVGGHNRDECQSDVMKCYHCKQAHNAGSRTCNSVRKEEEILAIQRKERVPRQQARVIFEREHPNFTMNYSSAVKSNPHQSESSGVPVLTTRTKARKQAGEQFKATIDMAKQNEGRDTEEKRSQQHQEKNDNITAGGRKAKDTEVVCVSPGSGKLFTATVQLQDGESAIDTDMETSESNTKLRKEVKEIYKELFQKANGKENAKEDDKTEEEDHEAYERQIRDSKGNRERVTRKKRSVSRRSRSKSRKRPGRRRKSRSRTRERSRDRGEHKRGRHDPTSSR